MSKKPQEQADKTNSPVQIDLSKSELQEAIMQGQAVLKEGKTKADAARLIFSLIQNEEKDVVVAVFVEGANLTPKGALTYWYNCRRRAAKEAKKAATSK
ncbi:hypothetical protein [Herbaspirillum chlorophenolicum]|uniref:hypothetical protein n=1 Tax=Herbaspirillum chlorophenolicum TaxID=211589 RepID=UPI000AAAFCC7|nr:hypothetical protein [Herbaspirillum chlorophenolicum]